MDTTLPEYRLSTSDIASAAHLKRLLHLASQQAHLFLHLAHKAEQGVPLSAFSWMPDRLRAARLQLEDARSANEPPSYSPLIKATTDVERYLGKLGELGGGNAEEGGQKMVVRILSSVATRLERKGKDKLEEFVPLMPDGSEGEHSVRGRSRDTERGRSRWVRQETSLVTVREDSQETGTRSPSTQRRAPEPKQHGLRPRTGRTPSVNPEFRIDLVDKGKK